MTCEQCGAPMRADRERGLFVCDYCSSVATPPIDDEGVLLLGPAKEKCPICSASFNQTLSTGSLELFSVLYCERCHGMLIPMDDFQPLISALKVHRDGPAAFIAPRSSSDAGRSLQCPKCGASMDNHEYGGGGNINIDSCETCEAVWLDRGELRKIVSAQDHAAYT
jgi:Zn-finger nucleic acid-binding protein